MPACLAAIRAEIERTGCEAEIVVVDNASTDGTNAAARAMSGVRMVEEPVRGLVQGGNFTVRRDVLSRAGGFDPRFSFHGKDTDVSTRMSRVGRVRFCWGLTALSSGRLRGDGLVMTGVRYGMYHLWTTVLRRPFTEAWNDYR